MNNIRCIIWLLPILFIFHDFEEIILMKPWINRNRSHLQNKFPKISNKFLSHFDNITTSSFALGVAEEFILISIITIISCITNKYELWLGLFVTFFLHLIILVLV